MPVDAQERKRFAEPKARRNYLELYGWAATPGRAVLARLWINWHGRGW